MPAHLKVTNEEIVAAYMRTGSVWKAGRELGISGQSVHERLRALRYPLAASKWTNEEHAELERLASERIPIGEIARRLGRPYAGVAGRMSHHGIRAMSSREKKLPRGVGLDKTSVAKHMKALERSNDGITRYCRANSLSIDLLVIAIQRANPLWWEAYTASHAKIEQRECPYCRRTFFPASGKQRSCSRKCQSDTRVDEKYFGGNRRNTLGLAEARCQLCGRENVKGLSSHHVLGKENDPDNGTLIALCAGCHNLVTLAATRNFIDDEAAWQSFISLVYLRKFGDRVASGECDGKALWVTVEIEMAADEGEDEESGVA